MQLHHLTARDIMTANVLSVKDTYTVSELAMFLCENGISGAPVVNENDEAVGVVSHTDIVNYTNMRGGHEKSSASPQYYRHEWDTRLSDDDLLKLRSFSDEETIARDIMTPVVFDVQENTPLEEVVEKMVKGKIHRLLVSQKKEIVGIITTMDLLIVLRNELHSGRKSKAG